MKIQEAGGPHTICAARLRFSYDFKELPLIPARYIIKVNPGKHRTFM